MAFSRANWIGKIFSEMDSQQHTFSSKILATGLSSTLDILHLRKSNNLENSSIKKEQ